MNEYLDVVLESDADGCLQDFDWSSGQIGSFSTYALGNLISIQLWEKLLLDLPDLNDQILNSEFAALLGWLRENVHKHGRKYESQELLKGLSACI